MTPGAGRVVSVEHMQKLSKDDVAALEDSMTTEWKSVLTVPEDSFKREYQSPSDKAYWTPDCKVRRVQSEPQSPAPACG